MAESGFIIDSYDLYTWHRQPTPNGRSLWAICSDAETDIAVGHTGNILESIDGTSWRVATELNEERWLAVADYSRLIQIGA